MNEASMGPQSFDCGSAITWKGVEYPEAERFNGAAVFRLRKYFGLFFSGEPIKRFNGAAVFRLRKLSTAFLSSCASFSLQWGRSLSTAEVNCRCIPNIARCGTSMGPQSFDCGSSS